MRHGLKQELTQTIEKQEKDQAFKLAFAALDKGELTIPELYQQVLATTLNNLMVSEAEMDDLIWYEHTLSSIVRSIIEAAYPYVLKEREKQKRVCDKRVLVFCPAREDHEIGARMVADFFVIMGYKVTFLGANTPESTVQRAVANLKPDYLSISVSNRYNLFETKRLIQSLRQNTTDAVKIIVGGSAFSNNEQAAQEVGADLLMKTFGDVEKLRKNEEADR